MVTESQQLPEARGFARSRLRRPGGLALAVLMALAASCDGCDGCSCTPYRRGWEKPPDPTAAPSDRFEGSEVLAAEHARIKARAERAHTLRIHVDADPVHLNPVSSPTVWTRRITADTVFESLIRYRPPDGGAGSGPGSYQPGLAESWTVAPGGREIRIDLQPDVRFHDGKKLSSVDVQFTLDALRHPRGPSARLRRLLSDIEGVDLATSRGVRIRLSRPSGYVLRALAEIPILPKHVYQRRLGSKRAPPIGTGPYKLGSRSDDRIQLVRWDDYWGDAPAIEKIEFVYEPDAARALIAAKRGELDVIPALIPAHYPEQSASPGIAARFRELELRPPVFRYLAVDTGEAPLSDVRVRRALVHLIDRKTIVDQIYDGMHAPIAGPVWPGGPGDGPSPAPPAFDPGEAYRLLDAAGWRDIDGDGRRERHGEKLRLALLALEGDDPERALIADTLRKAGVTLEVRVGTPGVLFKRLSDHEFDLALVEWRGTVDEDLSPLLDSGGSLNFGRFSDRRVDRVLAGLRETWDPRARAAQMGELATALAESWPLVPITRPDPKGLVHERVRGVVVWDGWISLRGLSLVDDAE
jgi:peptide/nickel transport system substrate-binding protein